MWLWLKRLILCNNWRRAESIACVSEAGCRRSVLERKQDDASAIRKLRGGHFDELTLFRVAPVLGLGARALRDLAQNEYHPSANEIEGLAVFNTPFHDMRVNAYLVWDSKSREAVAFDSGADSEPMLDQIAKAE